MITKSSAFRLEVSNEGIANLIFDVPNEKVNTFSLATLEELEEQLDKINNDPSILLLKLTSGKPDSFIAGADLKSIAGSFENPEEAGALIRAGHRIFSKLENLSFPTVAVINGFCVGGGLECALSCTYRIVTDHPKTTLGLPEVNLGIFPGWGGTQRLPRLVGLTEGLTMIVSGSLINGKKAVKINLADALVAWQFQDEQTDNFIKMVLTGEGKQKILQNRKQKFLSSYLVDKNFLARKFIYYKAKKMILEKTKGRYPAPLMALKVIKKTFTLPLESGLIYEMNNFIENVPEGFALAKDLINIFFTQEAAKKNPGMDIKSKGLEVEMAGVIGAGTMGSEIAWLLADHKIRTRIKDVAWDAVTKGLANIRGLFEKGLKKKKLTKWEFDRRTLLISGSTDFSGFQHTDCVIEAATENLVLKRKIFHELEEIVKPNTIIASNTSSLTISELSLGMKHPERFVGMHFFYPANKMPLVEVVGSKHTSPEAIATAVELSRKIGKTPIVVGDCPGFLVNRILLPCVNEMFYMLEEGFHIEQLDHVFTNFGMPMKPFALADEVGNDVTLKAFKSLEKGYGERMRPAKLLQLMVENEFLGRKKGVGFYIYNGDKSKLNSKVRRLIKQIGHKKKIRKESDILPRFLFPMINEAARCLEEGIVSRPDLLDLSLILGIGFPPFRGGLLRFADRIGAKRIVSKLQEFEQDGSKRFTPCNMLLDMAEKDELFYSEKKSLQPQHNVKSAKVGQPA